MLRSLMLESFGVLHIGLMQYLISGFDYLLAFTVVDLFRGQQIEAGMSVLCIVPSDKIPAEVPAVLN